jgi:uncharacterized protein YkuJ
MSSPRTDKSQTSPDDIEAICAAAVMFTKSLLGYGAENNWQDIQHSEGRSLNASHYRQNWLYLSSKDRLSRKDNVDMDDLTSSTSPSSHAKTEEKASVTYFFHNPSFELADAKKNYIARKATCAVLAHTRNCDEHAYVLSLLLRELLPAGTPINICAMRDKETNLDFPHTFVVVGHIHNEMIIPITTYNMNNNLLTADAWPTQGGVVKLKDFWLRDPANSKYKLHVDCTFIADNKDHLVKRVNKQIALLNAAANKQKGYEFEKSGDAYPLYNFHELVNMTKNIKTVPLAEDEYNDGYYDVQEISQSYTAPAKTNAMVFAICKQFPHLKKLLEWSDDQLENVPARLYSGPG